MTLVKCSHLFNVLSPHLQNRDNISTYIIKWWWEVNKVLNVNCTAKCLAREHRGAAAIIIVTIILTTTIWTLGDGSNLRPAITDVEVTGKFWFPFLLPRIESWPWAPLPGLAPSFGQSSSRAANDLRCLLWATLGEFWAFLCSIHLSVFSIKWSSKNTNQVIPEGRWDLTKVWHQGVLENYNQNSLACCRW